MRSRKLYIYTIRPACYKELRQLWEQLNKKYIIFFEKEVDKLIESALPELLGNGVFSSQIIASRREQIGIQDGTAIARETAGVQQIYNGKRIPYRDFLRRANRATSIPIMTLHNAIVCYSQQAPFCQDYIRDIQKNS